MTSTHVRPRRPFPALAPLLVSLASSLFFALPAAPLCADVVGIGDISPHHPNPDPPPVEEVPFLPQFGGTVPTVIVGGTGDFVGGTEAGQMTIDIPSDTDPLKSTVGAIGNTQGGQGVVRVLSLNSEWQITSGLYVAVFGQGSLQVTAGARVGPDPTVSSTTQQLKIFLGYAEGSQGYATVDGFTSLLKSRWLSIGRAGAGTLTVTNGGRIETVFEADIGGDAFTSASANDLNNGIGLVTLDGQATRWNVGIPASTGGNPTPDPLPNPNSTDSEPNADLYIGRFGRGSLLITNQAWTRVTRDIIIGSAANSYGEATITGLGSTMWALRNLNVGSAIGGGSLTVNDQGLVRVDGNVTVGKLGFINMGGGTLQTTVTTGNHLTNNGVIRGSGRIDTGLAGTITNNGFIRNGASTANLREQLLLTGPVFNNDAIESVGGEMEFQGLVTNNTGANILGVNAIYRFDAGLANSGGNLYFKNTLVWTPASAQTVTSSANLTVLEGESQLMGNLALTGGTMAVEVGHTSSLLSVNGTASLAGSLVVGAIDDLLGEGAGDGYEPHVGERFEILTASSVTGTFADVNDFFQNVNFTADYSDPTRVVLNVVAGAFHFNADFNGDGIVDGDDFMVWQSHNGTNVVPPGTNGDADGDGDVDDFDLGIWQDQFGSPPPAVAVAAAVPEPTGAALALSAVALLAYRKRR